MNPNEVKYFVAVTTCASEEEACALGKRVVENNLAACVQIAKTFSIYTWENKVSESLEWRLEMKTTANRLSFLEEYVRKEHKYSCPEFIYYEIQSSSQYGDWLKSLLITK